MWIVKSPTLLIICPVIVASSRVNMLGVEAVAGVNVTVPAVIPEPVILPFAAGVLPATIMLTEEIVAEIVFPLLIVGCHNKPLLTVGLLPLLNPIITSLGADAAEQVKLRVPGLVILVVNDIVASPL